MGNLFTGNEIISLGIQIEVNGKAFYEALIAKARSEEAKKIFTFLSREEEQHVEIFKKMLGAEEPYESSDSYPGEYMEYMKALSEEYIFTKEHRGEKSAENTKSDAEAVSLGIQFEKDSIVFYEGMKRVVPKAHHKTIEAVLEQEQRHLRQLNELRKKI